MSEYTVTFVGDYAHLATTVYAIAPERHDEDTIIAHARAHLVEHYGIDPERAGLASVDILVEEM